MLILAHEPINLKVRPSSPLAKKVAYYGSVSKSSGQWEGGGGGGGTLKPRARSKAVQRMRRLRFHSGIFANPAGKIVIFNFFQEPPHFAEMNSN